MTGKSIIKVTAGAIAVVLIAAAMAYACGEKGCPVHQATMKDIKVEVKNIDNGAVITMTADKPEAVKAIQEHTANCGKDAQGCCLTNGNIEVKNIENGAVVTMTADKPEAVKMIQEHAANCGKCTHACGFAPGSEECKKAHEDGGCRGHDSKNHCPQGEKKK